MLVTKTICPHLKITEKKLCIIKMFETFVAINYYETDESVIFLIDYLLNLSGPDKFKPIKR